MSPDDHQFKDSDGHVFFDSSGHIFLDERAIENLYIMMTGVPAASPNLSIDMSA